MKTIKNLIESERTPEEVINQALNEVHPRFWGEIVLGIKDHMGYRDVTLVDKGNEYVVFEAEDQYKFEVNVEEIDGSFQFEIVLRNPRTNSVISSDGLEVSSLANPRRITREMVELRLFTKAV